MKRRFTKRKILHYVAIGLSPIILASISYFCSLYYSSGRLLIDQNNQGVIFALLIAVLIVLCSNTSLSLMVVTIAKKLESVTRDLGILNEVILENNLKSHEEIMDLLKSKEVKDNG
jgi:hypothetical protein